MIREFLIDSCKVSRVLNLDYIIESLVDTLENNIYNVRTTHTTDKDLFFWRVSHAYHKPILSEELETGFFFVR